jgi:hypothetical protein
MILLETSSRVTLQNDNLESAACLSSEVVRSASSRCATVKDHTIDSNAERRCLFLFAQSSSFGVFMLSRGTMKVERFDLLYQ